MLKKIKKKRKKEKKIFSLSFKLIHLNFKLFKTFFINQINNVYLILNFIYSIQLFSNILIAPSATAEPTSASVMRVTFLSEREERITPSADFICA